MEDQDSIIETVRETGPVDISDMKIGNLAEWIREQKKRQIPTDFVPTEYKISTITTNCRFFYESDEGGIFPLFINYLTFFKYCRLSEEGVMFKKYRFRGQRHDMKEVHQYNRPPQKMTRKNSKMKGVFYNQVTLELFSDLSNKPITVFLYDNGSCNNTGNKIVEDTHFVCEKLMDVLHQFHNCDRKILFHYQNVNLSNWDDDNTDELESYLSQNLVPLDLHTGKLVCRNLNVSTMNAKYNAGIKINRDNLLKLIKRQSAQEVESNIYLALLETSNYAGLNIKIRWGNHCTESIHQKLKKKWKCNCSDITLLVFQSGEVMISGAKTKEQLDYVKYTFDKLIKENIEEIIDIDLQSIITIPSHKRIKRIHRYLTTTEVADKTFIVVTHA